MNTLIYLLIYVMINLQTITYLEFLNISCVKKRRQKWGKEIRVMNLLQRRLLFEDFVKEDRFELNLYLTYLLDQMKMSEKV